MRKTVRESIIKEEVDEIEAEVEETKKQENAYTLLNLDTQELELGNGLIPMVDTNQGGDLLDRVILIRRQIAIELGIVVPPVRIRDNMQLEPNKYLIKLKGVVMAEGELLLDRLLAMNPGEELQISGIETQEPAFGLPAIWIEEKDREEAEIAGCTVVDPPSVLSTHLTEFIKTHATEIISRQDVQNIINHVKETSPSVVDEVIPRLLSLSEVHRIIINLLNERVPVRDMVTIFEAIGDYSGVTKDLDILTEYVRQSISRQIVNTYLENNILNVVTLSPETEKIIRNSVQETDGGNYLALEPRQAQSIANEISDISEKVAVMGIQPVVLTPPIIRLYFRRLIERNFPSIPVLSYNEIPQNVNIEVVGTVNIK
jgi:flagellar biosynthesis protein FlhA